MVWCVDRRLGEGEVARDRGGVGGGDVVVEEGRILAESGFAPSLRRQLGVSDLLQGDEVCRVLTPQSSRGWSG